MEVGETLLVRNHDQWRRWLQKNHDKKKEIWVVFYKKTSGKTGMSYDESVEEALAYGWIDGQAKGIDEETWACRFTQRKPKSNWSESNIVRIRKLLADGRMAEPGLAVLPDHVKKLTRRASPSPLRGGSGRGS